jgi:hypothetical protein
MSPDRLDRQPNSAMPVYRDSGGILAVRYNERGDPSLRGVAQSPRCGPTVGDTSGRNHRTYHHLMATLREQFLMWSAGTTAGGCGVMDMAVRQRSGCACPPRRSLTPPTCLAHRTDAAVSHYRHDVAIRY